MSSSSRPTSPGQLNRMERVLGGRKFHPIWISTRLVAVAISTALFVEVSLADNAQVIKDGQALFEKEWEYKAPEVIDQGTMSDTEYAQVLFRLPGDGLGPMHNANSCVACHEGGGASGVDHNVTLLTVDPRSAFLKSGQRRDAESNKIIRNQLIDLFPGILSPTGSLNLDTVVPEKSTRPFYDSIRSGLARHIPGGARTEWFESSERTSEAVAFQPVLSGRQGEIDFYLSQRNSPPLFGLHLIDMIDINRLQRLAVAQSKKSEGKITGRLGPGKFGWRAQTPTLDQFVRGACAGELGLQVLRTPQSADLADETYTSLGVDMSDEEVVQLVSFVRSLPAPVQETRLPSQSLDARTGARLFARIGCADCHVQHIRPARNLFSDLLLHDMGPLLQAPAPAPLGARDTFAVKRMAIPRFAPERRPLGSRNLRFSIGGYYGSPSSQLPQPFALQRPRVPTFPYGSVPDRLLGQVSQSEWTWDRLQREWRTPPLWGVADSAPYLHDGRATTLDAAILWHGGEAAESTSQYRSLPDAERRQVIAFLKSLRAPVRAARQPERSISEQMVTGTAFHFDKEEVKKQALHDASAGVSVFDLNW